MTLFYLLLAPNKYKLLECNIAILNNWYFISASGIALCLTFATLSSDIFFENKKFFVLFGLRVIG